MKLDYYRHPPVDPVTGEVSAGEDSVLMGHMRHCDVPALHRKEGCVFEMNSHFWTDDGTEQGVTVCPDEIVEMIATLGSIDPRTASGQVLNDVLAKRGWRLSFGLSAEVLRDEI